MSEPMDHIIGAHILDAILDELQRGSDQELPPLLWRNPSKIITGFCCELFARCHGLNFHEGIRVVLLYLVARREERDDDFDEHGWDRRLRQARASLADVQPADVLEQETALLAVHIITLMCAITQYKQTFETGVQGLWRIEAAAAARDIVATAIRFQCVSAAPLLLLQPRDGFARAKARSAAAEVRSWMLSKIAELAKPEAA